MTDVTFEILPADYLAALATDAERWTSSSKPAWAGRRVWTLRKGVAERALWRLKGFEGECYHQRNQ